MTCQEEAMTQPIDTAEIRAELADVTEGPWRAVDVGAIRDKQTFMVLDADDTWVADLGHAPADARFIARARSLVPALCDALDEARAEVERLTRGQDEERRYHAEQSSRYYAVAKSTCDSLRSQLDASAATVAQLKVERDAAREELARWHELGERHDIKPREPGCKCVLEEGDTDCPVHPDEEHAAYAATLTPPGDKERP